jgi:hypothetical protein
LLAATFQVSAESWHDNSHYVPLGPRTGYYIVRPGSSLSHQLGIDGAPTVDTADPFNHGYGADALAFRFNRAGTLKMAPAYIVQGTPNQFYTQRLGSFIRGQTRLRDVKAFFGNPRSVERRSDGIVAYYAIQLYNPSEDRSGRGGR